MPRLIAPNIAAPGPRPRQAAQRLGAEFRLPAPDIPERRRLDCSTLRHVSPGLDSPRLPRYILGEPEKTCKARCSTAQSPESLLTKRPYEPVVWRQALFFAAVGSTIAGLIWLAAFALVARRLRLVDLVLLLLFAVTLPWSVIGFWNATIGFSSCASRAIRWRP